VLFQHPLERDAVLLELSLQRDSQDRLSEAHRAGLDLLPGRGEGATMGSAETPSPGAAGTPPVNAGEMRLEVVVLPVSDVDRAKRFYEGLGWRLDADLAVEDGYRVVQLTPPGSACSIIFGEGVTTAPPGSLQGLQLSVYDIDAARTDLVARGVEVSETFHDVTGISITPAPMGVPTGRRPSMPITARLSPSAIPTATAGCSRRSRPGFRAGERSERWQPPMSPWTTWRRR
jgi:catechol 2,3-dioxygenase-like lactoylglutathione lyase family enzyme